MNIQHRLLTIAASFLSYSAVADSGFHEWQGEALPGVQLQTVAYKAWLPERTTPLRGTLVLIPGRHGDGRGLASDAGWQEVGSAVGFAVIGCQFTNGEPYLYQGDPQGEVARAINSAVSKLAVLSKHPELEKAPLAFWGTSAGSNVAGRYSDFFPERVAAFASSKGTSGPGPQLSRAKEGIPMFFAVGLKDKPEWVAGSRTNIETGLKKNAPWAVAYHKNEGHEVGKSLGVAQTFLKAAIELRLSPAKGSTAPVSVFKTAPRPMGGSASTTATALRLTKADPRTGWSGNAEGQTIAPLESFKGSKASGTWLPDETTAKAWLEYLRN